MTWIEMTWIEMTWIEMTWIEMAFDMLYICPWENIIIVLTFPFSSTSVIEFTTPWLFFRPWCFSAVKWAPTMLVLNNCWSIALLFSPSIGSNVLSFIKIITNGNRIARVVHTSQLQSLTLTHSLHTKRPNVYFQFHIRNLLNGAQVLFFVRRYKNLVWWLNKINKILLHST